jgi:hypothetical protein
MNKKKLFNVIFSFLILAISAYAQVKIEIAPPSTVDLNGSGMGSGWNSTGSNGNSFQSLTEDVFELKNGSTIRGNLESFSGGVYFVNIGGVIKAIPENTISKINGQKFSRIKPTTPENTTAEVNVIQQRFSNSLSGIYNKNRLMLEDNKFEIDNDEEVGYFKTIGENGKEFSLPLKNGILDFRYAIKNGLTPIIKVDSEGIYGFSSIVYDGAECNGSPIPSSRDNWEKYSDVYISRWGENNLDGPVAKCNNEFLSRGINDPLFFAIDSFGFIEFAHFSLKASKIEFYKSSQNNNGLFAFNRRKHNYQIRKLPDYDKRNYILKAHNYGSGVILGYGHFINNNINNWLVFYYISKYHVVTKKYTADVCIDILNDDKSVFKNLKFSIPALSDSPDFLIVDVDRDGLLEILCEGEHRNNTIIIKLK